MTLRATSWRDARHLQWTRLGCQAPPVNVLFPRRREVGGLEFRIPNSEFRIFPCYPSTMDGYPFSCPIQVRWRDLDAFGHVNNATFASYLEIARTDAWIHLFPGCGVMEIPFFVKRLEIDYRRPIGLEEEVRVWLRVGELRGASLTFEYVVEVGGEVAAEAVTWLACVGDTGRPTRMDADLRATLETLQVG